MGHRVAATTGRVVNPFDLADHLVDRHLLSQSFVDSLDATEARQLHADDHAEKWPRHSHPEGNIS